MGDRCFLTIDIHGHVDTVGKLKAIIEALRLDALSPLDCGHHDAAYFAEFARALNDGRAPNFGDYEVNYARIAPTETALQQISQPYAVSHEEGGDYGPGAWSWSPDQGHVERARSKGEGAIISIYELRRMLSQPNPLRLIREEIQACDIAEGVGLPQFTASEEVHEFLEIELGGAA